MREQAATANRRGLFISFPIVRIAACRTCWQATGDANWNATRELARH